ncbi:response regulator transcription factor [Cohnella sp. WQ 127256]|uniref:response regulator transcription factor n=1 Tax=Cohnella sp. WQ 127256 TaxID=2938790 RepID=UPI002119931C|nr:response regulator transcription factor [Cohnella sp. WQ 127256]
MYTVLIVDDEPLIREGLRTIIDWEEQGFRVVDVASDAMEALRKVPLLKPRLMIVDIRMPGMDGLELLRTIQEQHRPCPRFLILSGYADFEYARTALQLKVDGYMLKPIDEDELIKYLSLLKDAIEEDDRKVVEGPDRESAIMRLMSGEDHVLNGRNNWNWSSYEVALVKLQSHEEFDTDVIAQAKNLLSDRFERAGKGVVFFADPYVGLLLKDTAAFRTAHSTVYRLISEVCVECRLDFIVVAGGAVPDQASLKASYERARSLMKHRFLYAGGKLYVEEPELPVRDTEAEDSSEEDKLSIALEAENPDAAEAALRRMGTNWVAAGASEQDIKSGFISRMSVALTKLSQTRPEQREHVRKYNSEVAALYSEYRYEHLLRHLFSICTEICGKLSENGAGADNQVRKMVELIHRNSSDNLKLESLAEALGYNSSYLGKLFKQETGENFNTYLDKVRIEKAKDLLRQGRKVYQVAERVGYTNVDYFHAKFRKYVGVSPISFRKNIGNIDTME